MVLLSCKALHRLEPCIYTHRPHASWWIMVLTQLSIQLLSCLHIFTNSQLLSYICITHVFYEKKWRSSSQSSGLPIMPTNELKSMWQLTYNYTYIKLTYIKAFNLCSIQVSVLQKCNVQSHVCTIRICGYSIMSGHWYHVSMNLQIKVRGNMFRYYVYLQCVSWKST